MDSGRFDLIPEQGVTPSRPEQTTPSSYFLIARNIARVSLWRVNKILLVILSFLLPPLAVYLKTSSVKTTLLNVVLCFFFWIPAVIHALWVSLK